VSEGEQPDQPRRSGWLRRLRRLIAALALAIVALLLVLHLPFVQRALIDLGIARLSGPIGARITYREVSFNLLSGRIELDGFSLGADGAPALVAADHVVVRFPWEALRVANLQLNAPPNSPAAMMVSSLDLSRPAALMNMMPQKHAALVDAHERAGGAQLSRRDHIESVS